MQEDFGQLLLQALFVQVFLDKGFLWNSVDEAKSFLKAEIQIIYIMHRYKYLSPCTPCNLWFHNRIKVCCSFATGFNGLLLLSYTWIILNLQKRTRKKDTNLLHSLLHPKNSQKQPQPKFHPSRISRPSGSAAWKSVCLKLLPVGTIFAKC